MADLTGEAVACAMLFRASRQPYDGTHLFVLADYLEDRGATWLAAHWLRPVAELAASAYPPAEARRLWQGLCRPQRLRQLRDRRDELTAAFGDFEGALRRFREGAILPESAMTAAGSQDAPQP